MLTCFDMIWNCDKFSKQNTKFGKIYTLFKIHIYSKNIFEKMTYWGNYKEINNKFQNISFENSSLWKMFFWARGPKKRQWS
jgi:hypothetical protein